MAQLLPVGRCYRGRSHPDKARRLIALAARARYRSVQQPGGGVMRTRLVAILASSVVVVLLGASAANATLPGANGKIVFVRQDACGSNLECHMFTINPDGSGETLLAAGGQSPRWSPSGTQLAFDCGLICISQADGSSVRHIEGGPEQSFTSGPAWSPDGTRIAFSAGYPVHFAPPPDIWVINADGTGNTPLAREGLGPAWSSDGTRIAFTSIRDVATVGIDVMNADGSGRTSITNGPVDSSPSWSPDGRRISFTRGDDIFVVNSDGSGTPAPITSGPELDYQPVWSPDGRKIAFGRSDRSATNYGLYVMNADGSSPTLLADKGVQPDWQAIPQAQEPKRFCKAERKLLGNKAFRQKYGRHALKECIARNAP
jgi:TolB protein